VIVASLAVVLAATMVSISSSMAVLWLRGPGRSQRVPGSDRLRSDPDRILGYRVRQQADPRGCDEAGEREADRGYPCPPAHAAKLRIAG
jgi:hypothetical protein